MRHLRLPQQNVQLPIQLQAQQDYLDQQARMVEALAAQARRPRQPFVQAGRFVVPMSNTQGLAQLGESLAAALGMYANRKGRQDLYGQLQQGRQKAIDAYMKAIRPDIPKTYGELSPPEMQRLEQAGAPQPAYTSKEFAPGTMIDDPKFTEFMHDYEAEIWKLRKQNEEFAKPPEPPAEGIPYRDTDQDIEEYDIAPDGTVRPSIKDSSTAPQETVQTLDEYNRRDTPISPPPPEPISRADSPLGPTLPPNPNAPIPEHLLPLVTRQPSSEELNMADMQILMNDFAPPALRQLAATRIQQRSEQAMASQNLMTQAQLDAWLKKVVSGDTQVRVEADKDIANKGLEFNREKLQEMIQQQEEKLLLQEKNKLFDREGNFNQDVYDKLIALNQAKRSLTNIDLGDKFASAVIPPTLKEAMATKEMAMGALKQYDAIQRIRQALDSGNIRLGPGATWRHYADQLANVLGIAGQSTEERLKNTRMVIQGLAEFTINARKSLKNQGTISDKEQEQLKEAASGEIQQLTGPELRRLLEIFEDAARGTYRQHETVLGVIKAIPEAERFVPVFEVPAFPEGEEGGKGTSSDQAPQSGHKYPWERDWK